jgi:hypothetical protein
MLVPPEVIDAVARNARPKYGVCSRRNHGPRVLEVTEPEGQRQYPAYKVRCVACDEQQAATAQSGRSGRTLKEGVKK